VVLYNEKVLTCIKSKDQCTIHNVLKWQQSLIDGNTNPSLPSTFESTTTSTLASICVELGQGEIGQSFEQP
jgi:hypothetical protein